MSTNGNTELAVTIMSEGGALTLTPRSLLEHFLPGAQPMPDNPRVFVGHLPGKPEDLVYVQQEALAGMLLDSREKRINPITGMYLIPSNHWEKRASHKVKYDVGLQRARKVPGFLGLNFGLLVKRSDAVVETHGAMAIEADVILGSWAELYLQGLAKPLRYEVSAKEFWGVSNQWKTKGAWMMCKVAIDHLLRLNFPTLFQLPDEAEADTVLLEAVPMPEPGLTETPRKPSARPLQASAFVPGQVYAGTVKALQYPSKAAPKKPGSITLQTEHGPLTAQFWSRPEVLRKTEDARHALGIAMRMTFAEKTTNGQVYRNLVSLELAGVEEPGETIVDPSDGPAVQPGQGSLL